jgi:3-hydroxyisobutyrate dehydrogenase-like beta-hydroxyacid dehydrogenase
MAEKKKIGFIGVGKMGNPMARNLIKNGYALKVFDVVPEARQVFADHGAEVVDSATEAATNVDLVISSIPDNPALEDVALGEKGVLAGAGKGTTYMDMSTVSPTLSDKVDEVAKSKGVSYLRAPVSGSVEAAEAGILAILCSGPRKAYEGCKDILDIMGAKVFHVGEKSEALYMKLLINMMVGVTSAVTAEALAFGKKGGLDWDQMIDMIHSSVIGSPLIGFKAPMMKSRDFTAAFSVWQMSKDFNIALNAGREMDMPMPLTSYVQQLYGAMKATGRAERDYFGLIELMEEMGGLK